LSRLWRFRATYLSIKQNLFQAFLYNVATIPLVTAIVAPVSGDYDYLQSVSNPIVYAAGDAAAKGPPLTPVSSHDAKVVTTNILEGNLQQPDIAGSPVSRSRCRRLPRWDFRKRPPVNGHRTCG
jgi:hypothetical protein